MKFFRKLFSDDPFVAGVARMQFVILLFVVDLGFIVLVL